MGGAESITLTRAGTRRCWSSRGELCSVAARSFELNEEDDQHSDAGQRDDNDHAPLVVQVHAVSLSGSSSVGVEDFAEECALAVLIEGELRLKLGPDGGAVWFDELRTAPCHVQLVALYGCDHRFVLRGVGLRRHQE